MGDHAWAALSEDELLASEPWGALSDSEASEAWQALSSPGAEDYGEDDEIDEADLHDDVDAHPAPAEREDAEYGHGLGEQRLPAASKRLRHTAIAGMLLPIQEAIRDIRTAVDHGRADAGDHGDGDGAVEDDIAGAMVDDEAGAFATVDSGGGAGCVAAAAAAVDGDANAMIVAVAPSGGHGVEVANALLQPREQVFATRFENLAVGLERTAMILNAIWAHPKRDPRIDPDEGEVKVVDHLLAAAATATNSIMSAAVEASAVGTSRKSLRRFRRMLSLSALLVHVQDCVRMMTRVGEHVRASGGTCVCIIEKYKGDETSLRYTVADREETKDPGASAALARPGAVAMEATAKQSAITKVLQSHRSIAAVFQTVDKEYFMIHASLPMPLQVMSSTKQEVYYRCFQRTSLPLAELSAMFGSHLRLCISDGDLSVAASLRAVDEVDTPLQWHYSCDVHEVSNLISSMMEPAFWQHHISRLIHFAKSLQMANTMREFREALRLAISARLRWRRLRPRTGDMKRNAFIARLCIHGERRTDMIRIAVIVRLFNGCWERVDVVEHNWPGPGCCRDREHCIDKMVGIGVACIAGCGPTTFPRHRWTGFKESVSWPLLLESIHGLLSLVYRLWAAGLRGGQDLSAELQRHVDLARAAAAANREAPEVAQMVENVADAWRVHARDSAAASGAATGTGIGIATAEPVDADPQPSATLDKRQEQSHNRHAALGWLADSDPLGAMYVMRVAVGPAAACMDRYLRVAGQRWEHEQAVAEAAAHLDPSKQGRTFRATLVESSHFEGPSLDEVRQLMSSQAAWEHLPARHRTAALRTRATLMLSRVGSGMVKLKQQHGNYPCKLFSILRDEAEADSIEAEKECRFDPWSWGIIEAYRHPGGMRHPDLRAKLQAVAFMMEFEMASVEAFQAALRRLCHVLSCQTHTEHILDAGAEWVLRRFRALLSRRRSGGRASGESARPNSSGTAGAEHPGWAKVDA